MSVSVFQGNHDESSALATQCETPCATRLSYHGICTILRAIGTIYVIRKGPISMTTPKKWRKRLRGVKRNTCMITCINTGNAWVRVRKGARRKLKKRIVTSFQYTFGCWLSTLTENYLLRSSVSGFLALLEGRLLYACTDNLICSWRNFGRTCGRSERGLSSRSTDIASLLTFWIRFSRLAVSG